MLQGLRPFLHAGQGRALGKYAFCTCCPLELIQAWIGHMMQSKQTHSSSLLLLHHHPQCSHPGKVISSEIRPRQRGGSCIHDVIMLCLGREGGQTQTCLITSACPHSNTVFQMWNIYRYFWSCIQVHKIPLVYPTIRGGNRHRKDNNGLFSQSKGSLEGVVGEPEAFSTARMKFRACCISHRNHWPGAGLTIITGTGFAWRCSQLLKLLQVHPRDKCDSYKSSPIEDLQSNKSSAQRRHFTWVAVVPTVLSEADTRLSTPLVASSWASASAGGPGK